MAFSCLLLLTSSCGFLSHKPETGIGLTEAVWKFTGFQTADGLVDSPGPEEILLTFTNDGRVHGRSERNKYHGIYQTSDDRLTIDSTGTTLAGLIPNSKYNEYYGALKQARSYEIKDNRLSIAYDQSGEALLFKPKKLHQSMPVLKEK